MLVPFLMAWTFLFHLSISPPVNLAISMHNIFRVSTVFHCWLSDMFSHFSKKFVKLLECFGITKFDLGPFLYLPSIWLLYLSEISIGFSKSDTAVWYPWPQGSWIQCLISSFGSPTINFISLASLPLGSSVLVCTTLENRAIK